MRLPWTLLQNSMSFTRVLSVGFERDFNSGNATLKKTVGYGHDQAF
jgi:hypothetical protein